MTATNSIIKGANAVDSDSYPFSQYASSYLKLSRCGFYNTDQALKTERGDLVGMALMSRLIIACLAV